MLGGVMGLATLGLCGDAYDAIKQENYNHLYGLGTALAVNGMNLKIHERV